MYEIRIKGDFAAAHNLRDVGGKCESLHGHNFTVEVAVESEALDELGMVMDFRLLKDKTRAVLEILDHRYLNEVPPFDRLNPSSENMARHLFEEMERKVPAPATLS